MASEEHAGTPEMVAVPAVAATAIGTPMRDRFVRYTPPAAPMPVPPSASFALRKS
jgi:hypothetical protein